MGKDDFFDDFEEDVGAVDKALFDDQDFEQFRALLLNEQGSSLTDLQQQFTELVARVLAGKGKSLQEAQAAAADPYVAATLDAEAFEQLVKEVAVAAEAAGTVKENEEWVPPPPDAVPEKDLDYA